MKRLFLLIAFCFIGSLDAWGTAQTTAFTYQGHLLQNGVPTSGTHNLMFTLWDSTSGGAQVGSSITQNNYPVANGVFNIDLDFGSSVFNGQQRYLDVNVDGTELTPRQPVNSTPVAIFALSSANGTSVTGTTSNNQFTNDHLYAGVGVVGQNFPMVMTASPNFNPAGKTTQAGYTNGVDVLSLTSGLDATLTLGGAGGAGVGKTSESDIRVLASIDPAYKNFLANMFASHSFASIQIDVLNPSTGDIAESYCYANAFVTELQPMPQSGLVEIRFVTTAVGYRISQGSTNVEFGWNLTTYMSMSPPCVK